MSLSIQLYTMLSMAAMGIWLGAAIDTYGRFSKKRPSFHLLVALNDILFWIVQGLVVFYVLLKINNGEIRFYIFLALLCGYAAYQAIFRSYFQLFLDRMIQFSIGFYKFVKRLFIVLLYQPIKYVLQLLYSLCIMILSALLAVSLWILRLFWKPIKWFLLLIYRLTRLDKVVNRYQPLFKKVKGIIESVRKKKE
ncbi:spore cortex biosynthesis protein YabQ [Halalkalibacter urbisdiaboli]|uniref:spore cortex biosynthesis protein YabQ n=1 Tax=Halalkalibacter urbisdiaboli TaxID=1960589 RepID=UPI000B4534E2|nr:spore cortex biosynthesis protein YabQ [Halalkalibacter urbisdiaboli]